MSVVGHLPPNSTSALINLEWTDCVPPLPCSLPPPTDHTDHHRTQHRHTAYRSLHRQLNTLCRRPYAKSDLQHRLGHHS
jgi:hypothetical protein